MNSHNKIVLVVLIVTGIVHARLSIQERNLLMNKFENAIKSNDRKTAEAIIAQLRNIGESILANKLANLLPITQPQPFQKEPETQDQEIPAATWQRIKTVHSQRINSLNQNNLESWKNILANIIETEMIDSNAKQWVSWIFYEQPEYPAIIEEANLGFINELLQETMQRLAQFTPQQPEKDGEANPKEQPYVHQKAQANSETQKQNITPVLLKQLKTTHNTIVNQLSLEHLQYWATILQNKINGNNFGNQELQFLETTIFTNPVQQQLFKHQLNNDVLSDLLAIVNQRIINVQSDLAKRYIEAYMNNQKDTAKNYLKVFRKEIEQILFDNDPNKLKEYSSNTAKFLPLTPEEQQGIITLSHEVIKNMLEKTAIALKQKELERQQEEELINKLLNIHAKSIKTINNTHLEYYLGLLKKIATYDLIAPEDQSWLDKMQNIVFISKGNLKPEDLQFLNALSAYKKLQMHQIFIYQLKLLLTQRQTEKQQHAQKEEEPTYKDTEVNRIIKAKKKLDESIDMNFYEKNKVITNNLIILAAEVLGIDTQGKNNETIKAEAKKVYRSLQRKWNPIMHADWNDEQKKIGTIVLENINQANEILGKQKHD